MTAIVGHCDFHDDCARCSRPHWTNGDPGVFMAIPGVPIVSDRWQGSCITPIRHDAATPEPTMFTICIAMYASLVSVDAISTSCYTDATKALVDTMVSECKALDRDPLTTCESRRAGALKYFITVRKLEGV